MKAAGSECRGHKKTVSEAETVAGQNSEKSNGNANGKIDSSEDLAASSRLLGKKAAALHRHFFWLKHYAKLRYCYGFPEQVKVDFPVKTEKRV